MVDAVTANVTTLEYLNGNVVQQNSSGNWYSEPGPNGPWTQVSNPNDAGQSGNGSQNGNGSGSQSNGDTNGGTNGESGAMARPSST